VVLHLVKLKQLANQPRWKEIHKLKRRKNPGANIIKKEPLFAQDADTRIKIFFKIVLIAELI
jgi:hypothetical protein